MLTSLVIIARQPALSSHFAIRPAFSPALRVSFRTFCHSAAPTKPSPSIVSAHFPSPQMGSTPLGVRKLASAFPAATYPASSAARSLPPADLRYAARGVFSPFLAQLFPRTVAPLVLLLHVPAVFCTFLHRPKSHPLFFQHLPHSLQKNTGGGYLPTAIKRYAPRRGTSRAARGICFSLHSPLVTRHFICATWKGKLSSA
jgi:hypothetical protein